MSYAVDSKDEMEKEILYLLDYLVHSDCEFNRNGKWYDAYAARQHINYKYKYLIQKGLINSTEQFIVRAASESSMSGKPYMVKCGDSEPIKSSIWFKKEFGSLKSSSRHKVLGYGVHIPGNVFPSDL